jgi:vacuolar-type H+-ATPase subunit H
VHLAGAGAPRVQNIVKSNAPTRPTSDPAEAAIARVLQAERDARDLIEQARRQAGHIAESARAEARALAERTEQRIRSVVGAFDEELARRLAVIDGEAAHMAAPHVLADAELRALDRAVHLLAVELTGGATS